MTRTCACGNTIPNWKKIDGKVRNLTSRRRCLQCLPFGTPCGRWTGHVAARPKNKRLQFYEWRAAFIERTGECPITAIRRVRKRWLMSLLGNRCCLCGYDRCQAALEFHHVCGKDHQISNFLQRKMVEVLAEVAKCVLICGNCHAEAHAGAVDVNRIRVAHVRVAEILRPFQGMSWRQVGAGIGVTSAAA